ncbi:MAG: site-specific DNA-methyltransferase [Leptospiraceae bacterium]|nr:site-specific DNA-methyltransferase [Leptospiraceae bacterium]
MARALIARKEEQILVGEFWTSKQRQAHPIHYTISYRAAFKPELPEFFIKELLFKKKSVVLDPFGGRGTTAIQANIDGHYAIHNDANPLSLFLASSRKVIPKIELLEKKLNSLNLRKKVKETAIDEDLLHFFHKDTLIEIKNLMSIYNEDKSPEMTYLMVTALSRLHGHSTGFFSVYTFPQISIPPNAQARNNIKRNQKPEYREVKSRILKKLQTDLKLPLPAFYHEFSKKNEYTNFDSTNLSGIDDNVVDLVVTSPPFLDKVNYIEDNWMKTWFLSIHETDHKNVSIYSSLDTWKLFIEKTLQELSRVMKKNAQLVMEVGDVQYGKSILNLDEVVLRASEKTDLHWTKTYINSQKFTKLSNCWNIKNNEKGTNSNRCVVLTNKKK